MRRASIWRRAVTAALLLSTFTPAAVAQTRAKGKKPAQVEAAVSNPSVRPPAPEGTLASAGRNLPAAPSRTSKVEIGEGISSPEMSLTLAVGESTYFHCQDEVLQLVFGDPDAFTTIWSTKESNRSDFYLVPKRGGVSTNLRIEMKSNTVTTRLYSIAPKGGARPGDYNSDVVVRPTGYRDKMSKLKSRVTELEQAKAALEQKTATQARDAEQKLAAVTADLTGRTSATSFALLKALGGEDARRGKQPKLPEAEADGVRVSQASRAVRDGSNRWWLLIRVVAPAKGKKVAGGAVIERLTTTSGRMVVSDTALPKVIAGGGEELMPLMLDTATVTGETDGRSGAPTLTVTLAGGKSVNLNLVP